MKTYRRKPDVVEAEQFLIYDKTLDELQTYCNRLGVTIKGPSNLVGFVSFSLDGVSIKADDWVVETGPYTKIVVKANDFVRLYEEA